MFEIGPQEVLWSIWGSHQTLWSPHLPNVTWHSWTWSSTVTPLTDQTLHHFWTYHRTGPYNQFRPYYHIPGGFHRTLQRVRLANRERLLLRTPGPVPYGTCICSNVETILSWTCHVYGPFEFRTSLVTSILLRGDNVMYYNIYWSNVLTERFSILYKNQTKKDASF